MPGKFLVVVTVANFCSFGWISIEKIGLSELCTKAGFSSFILD